MAGCFRGTRDSSLPLVSLSVRSGVHIGDRPRDRAGGRAREAAARLLVEQGRPQQVAQAGRLRLIVSCHGVLQALSAELAFVIFLTRTAIEIDEELMNRCVVLTVDEEREQTRAIHRLQRERQTLEGLLARVGRERTLASWCTAALEAADGG